MISESPTFGYREYVNEMKYCGNIMLSDGVFTDLSELLGVGNMGTSEDKPDGGFELQLIDAGSFERGDKFVYNLNVAKDVQGADRAIKTEQVRNVNSPDNWDDSMEVYKTNQFKPEESFNTSAKVVFLIDNSGSMGTAFRTVQKNVSAFLAQIKNQGVSDVQVAVARYIIGLNTTTADWRTTSRELEADLAAPPSGGLVDPYQSVLDALDLCQAANPESVGYVNALSG